MTSLVFWHGWGMSPSVWDTLIGELRAVMPDDVRYDAMLLPGYGASALPDGDPVDGWADAMMASVSEPVVLCGWSMGAILALQAAARHPDKVQRLVLFGATPAFAARKDWLCGMPRDTGQAFRQGVQSDPKTTMRRFVSLFNRADRHGREIVRLLSQLEMPPVAVLDAGLDFLDNADFRALVPSIRQKTLLIHGENDPLMPPDAVRWLEENLPDATLTLLPDVAHAPFLSEPKQCATSMAAFMERA